MSNEIHTNVDVLIEPSDRAGANCQVTDLEGFWFPPHPMVMLIPHRDTHKRRYLPKPS